MTKKESDNSQVLALVDGSSYLYRAFHAMPNLTNSAREPTGAVYGVINMLKRLIDDLTPSHMAVVFDAPGRTFREKLYPEYKANRAPMPPMLVKQIESIHEVVRAMGLLLVQMQGVEADDVIGTLARKGKSEGYRVVISSGDKDLAQLVDDDVCMIDTMKGITYDRAGVTAKFGVTPDQIVDYLTLMGDTVDNIPGVPKVGAKTAAKWLNQYGSLDNVIANTHEIKGKVGENLRGALSQLSLSRQLVTIKCDVELTEAISKMERQLPDENRLRQLYQKMEFKTWLRQLGERQSDDEDLHFQGEVNYQIITHPTQFEKLIDELKQVEQFAFDTETTSLDPLLAQLIGLSISTKSQQAVYIPLAHKYEGVPQQLELQLVLKKLKPLLESGKIIKIGQNIKYDQGVLEKYAIDLHGCRFDTMLESYVLDSTSTRHDMDSLAAKYLGYVTTKYQDVVGTGKSQIPFQQVPLDKACHYAAEDADITLRLHECLWPKLQQNDALLKVFNEIEMPLVSVLGRIERQGVKIDCEKLLELSTELSTREHSITKKAYELVGREFNLSSPKQIQEILYGELSLPVLQKTPKGQPSTAENVLERLANDYELPGLILNYRSLAKLRSTYTEKLPLEVNPLTQRVHTSYHQAVAATGRLSSADPNLQNIPIRSVDGRRIREAFIAPPGYQLVAIDYSQIELRIMAHLSQDDRLCQAFSANEDIHQLTASEVFQIHPDQVSNNQRRHAKAVNFGLIYGMSAFGLSNQLKIERKQAQQYIDHYFARYPKVKDYMEKSARLAKEFGYVETVFGRRLYLPEINASNAARRRYAERTAINAPMQGSAADIIKLAMIEVDKWIRSHQMEVNIILQVHDELVLEVADSAIDRVLNEVPSIMTQVAHLSVPLLVDTGVGLNWAAAHE